MAQAGLSTITIKCDTQDDYTGSDTVILKWNGVQIGGEVSISSGETRDLPHGEILLNEGDTLQFEEYDLLGSNEVLLVRQVTTDDFAEGCISLGNTGGDALYTFTICFIW